VGGICALIGTSIHRVVDRLLQSEQGIHLGLSFFKVMTFTP